MKIAILGTRGIPNNYGGFEQFAEFLAKGLVKLGHDVTVFNSAEHQFKGTFYEGVKIIHKFCPEKRLGAFAHFIYDWKCSKEASKSNFDIIYHAGYQSSAPSIFYFARKSKATWITNMDGLEWKRDKWGYSVKKLTLLMEKLALKYSDHIISDNEGIQKYYLEKFNHKSKYLAYGSQIPKTVSQDFLSEFRVNQNNYFIIVARLEPENSIEMILDGYRVSEIDIPFIVVGNHNTKFGKYLKNKYSRFGHIRFIGGVYDQKKLNSLRKFSLAYFHGHTVGGTNPSLLEAMALGSLIFAHRNSFNKNVLLDFGKYFDSKEEVTTIIKEIHKVKNHEINTLKNKCTKHILEYYNWDKIIDEHESYFYSILK